MGDDFKMTYIPENMIGKPDVYPAEITMPMLQNAMEFLKTNLNS